MLRPFAAIISVMYKGHETFDNVLHYGKYPLIKLKFCRIMSLGKWLKDFDGHIMHSIRN